MTLDLKEFDEILADLLLSAEANLQQITNFNDGSVIYGLLATVASGLTELYKQIGEGVGLAFAKTSSGIFLDAKAEEFNLTRKPALKTQGTVYFGRDVANGAKVIAAGTIASTVTDNSGNIFRYLTDVEETLPAGETEIAVAATAESVGKAYNVGAGSIDTIVTPVPGIDWIENRADWITAVGTDRETDAELAARIGNRWTAITYGATRLTYESWASEVNGVGEVVADDTQPRGAGTVDVIFLAVGGLPPPPSLIAEVQALLDARKPLTSDVLAKEPTFVLQDINVTASKHPQNGEQSAVKADIEGALNAMFVADPAYPEVKLLGIGENLTLARITQVVMDRNYVINNDIIDPTADLVIDYDQKASLDNLTVTVDTALEP